ncbi:MAG: rhamnogalacturonan lyase [Verrucomicrobiales bacterium]
MTFRALVITTMTWGAMSSFTPRLLAQRQMENLSRGLVAVKQEGGVFVSWRLFGTDPDALAFRLLRRTDQGEPVEVSDALIAGATNFVDTKGDVSRELEYSLVPVLGDQEFPRTAGVRAWEKLPLRIPIQQIADYQPGDSSIADLDGDGEYEIVLHQVSRGRDNSFAGVTGTPVFDAYEMDGTHLWRIDLGINIRDGEHYTQFMVYDLDGDGRAEMACKTADGTKDGTGKIIGDADKDWRTMKPGDPTDGRILDGPEYFTIFDGKTGAALTTVDYIPNRYPIDGWGGIGGNGGNDSYGNRCDRFLACVAYLDGERPSVVMCRGVYGRIVMAAWDWRDGNLSSRWVFDSGSSYKPFDDASPFSGMGGHSLSVADVDSDGKDEIVYQAMVVDDDGKGLFSTGRRHGDSMHLGDFNPDRPGQELFLISENEGYTVKFKTPGAGLHDARTGELLWSHSEGIDVGQGLVADIDPRYRGAEMWGNVGGLRASDGTDLGQRPRSVGFAVWWDGDLLRELVSGSRISKWNWQDHSEDVLQVFDSESGRRRWRRLTLVGDILGDWREGIITPSPEGDALLLYTTTIPTEHRLPTLMHDPQYRLGMAWQNVVYNKPPHPSFYLGEGMSKPPKPKIRLIGQGESIHP